jgi:hypothetical protein
LCFRREVEIVEREHLLEVAPRIAEHLGPCGRCGLEAVRMKGSSELSHLVPVLPVETRPERAAAAAGHRPTTTVQAAA